MSTSRIADVFAQLKRDGRKGFIPFITAGDPNLTHTYELVLELSRAGATVIELGVPFTDPMADGPVIQRASERALHNRTGISEVLDVVATARHHIETPIVLFSYFNPLLQFGIRSLAAAAKEAGVDGVLATDLAAEEAEDFSAALKIQGIDLIFLVAPTSSDQRLQLIAERASGFIYAISRPGVTGTREDLSDAAEELVTRVRRFSSLPVAVGFGISNAEQVARTWQFADAAVIGSAIVAEIERSTNTTGLAARVGEFCRSLLPDKV